MDPVDRDIEPASIHVYLIPVSSMVTLAIIGRVSVQFCYNFTVHHLSKVAIPYHPY